MQLAFLIDPLASLKPKKDSSLALMVEGARRGHKPFSASPARLMMCGGDA